MPPEGYIRGAFSEYMCNSGWGTGRESAWCKPGVAWSPDSDVMEAETNPEICYVHRCLSKTHELLSHCVQILGQATMQNPRLPAELLDHIADLLHDVPRALGSRCFLQIVDP